MKHLLAAILLLCAVGLADAQTLQCIGDRCTFTVESPDPKLAHDGANDFSRLVGDRLKAQYPSQVLDPRVDLAVYILNGKKIFHLMWSVRIVRTIVPNADWQFDRRGTLLWGRTLQVARDNVEMEFKKSGKVSTMRQGFKSSNIPPSFVRDSYSGSSLEGYWYIKEYFLVAPK